jgi:hypothetical protein
MVVQSAGPVPDRLDPKARAFYTRVLELLRQSPVPFLVGGAYALERYTGIQRHTKDLDVFVHRRDLEAVRDVLAGAGYRTEVTFPHWLAKAYGEGDFVDLIFASGNGLCVVDDRWFAHARRDEVLGVPVGLCPPEEMIWSKAFIMERERYDGADIAHLIRATGWDLDWRRLLERFGPHWAVLFSHLVLFTYIYPAERGMVPAEVTRELTDRLQEQTSQPAPGGRVCHGPLLSRGQYLPDIECWGYEDVRLAPAGTLSAEEIARWTEPARQPHPT